MAASEMNDATLMIRLPTELKAELMRQAARNGRRITAEINWRLKRSLEAATDQPAPNPYTAPNTPTVAFTNDNGPAGAISDTDRAMLEIFRKLPVDKQLALLSLFR